MKVLYCENCLWSMEIQDGTAIANKCDNCGKEGLRWISGTKEEINEFFDKLSKKIIKNIITVDGKSYVKYTSVNSAGREENY